MRFTSILVTTLASFAVSAQVPEGLVGCWPADGNANDIINGNNGSFIVADGVRDNTGELRTTPTFEPGLMGQAFSFDGSLGEAVQVPNNTVLEPANEVTVSTWINSTNEVGGEGRVPGLPYIIGKGADSCGFSSYALYWDSAFYVSTTNPQMTFVEAGGPPIYDGNWHHLVGTYSITDGRATLYVDGVPYASSNVGGHSIDYSEARVGVTQDLFFGRWPGDECIKEYVGRIDEVQIYYRALTEQEVATLYNGGEGLSCVGPQSVTALIDVKPGSDTNCVNINGHGVIPVAVLGSEEFDPSLVDPMSLKFGALQVRMRGKKGPLCGFEDVNADGIEDMICHFEDDPSVWEPDNATTATLTGLLADGTEFSGSDGICVQE